MFVFCSQHCCKGRKRPDESVNLNPKSATAQIGTYLALEAVTLPLKLKKERPGKGDHVREAR